MEYSLLSEGAQKRIVFYGNIVPSSRPKILEIAEKMPSSEQKKWIIDVHEFEFIDSAGLGMLIELQEHAKKNGITLTLTGANKLVRRMFELSKFDVLFEIDD